MGADSLSQLEEPGAVPDSSSSSRRPVSEPSADDSGERSSLVDSAIVPRRPPERNVDLALRELARTQAALTGHLAWAQAELSELPYDVSARAAAGTVASRLSDLIDVREAIDLVLLELFNAHAAPSLVCLYVSGVQRWIMESADALSRLALALTGLEADWERFRSDLQDAKAEWPTELEADAELDTMSIEGGAQEAFAELVFALHVLDANLAQRFG